MRYIWQHISTITETYDGSLPLAHFLKNYFKQYPILGSRDRRILSAMAYSWYRSKKGLTRNEAGTEIEPLVKNCLSVCNVLLPSFPLDPTPPMAFDIEALFPYNIPHSKGISSHEWLQSMLSQPDLFIRVRKNKTKIIDLLRSQDIPFNFITDNCLSLPNGAKIDALLPPDSYVVQDASSQKTGDYFKPKKNEQWYDCCAGAGGKSLLLKDMEPGVRLIASDLRETILHNLRQRFKLYGHTLPETYATNVADKLQLEKALGGRKFDNIICDAPCSGSGTWARTPEQLYFFDPAVLDKFSALQKTIAVNAARYLKASGRLLYITCSVFEAENEQVVEEITGATGLTLVRSQLINGTGIHADSMYIAELVSEEFVWVHFKSSRFKQPF